MTEKHDNGYEDSYQKRERLQRELQDTMNEIRSFFEVFERDHSNATDSLHNSDSLGNRAKELMEQEKDLEDTSKKQEIELAGLEDIDAKIEKEVEILATREALIKIMDEIESILDEMEKTTEVGQGQTGDSEGVLSVIEMKWQKFKEIKEQLDELDK